jgi:GntR family transcriptional regulator / MocR family aminotransferase
MEQGQFAVHIRRMRRLYASRRQAVLNVFEPYNGKAFTVDAPPSGLSINLLFDDRVDDEELTQKLARDGIEVQALSSYFAGREKKRGLVLSFAGFSEKDLIRAAQKLVAAL